MKPDDIRLKNLQHFKPGQSGFAGRKLKGTPNYWLKEILQHAAPAVLEGYINGCRGFYNYPKSWKPSHIELMQNLRLRDAYKKAARGNFDYLDMIAERLDGKPGTIVRINENETNETSTVVVTPAAPLPDIKQPDVDEKSNTITRSRRQNGGDTDDK